MQQKGRNVMRSVKLDKNELLDIVRVNKEKHISDFAESVEDYKLAVLVIAKENLKLAKTGDENEFKKFSHFPGAPKSYESDYSRAIRMLELSVEDTIELEDDVFNQLVLDEWSWKSGFVASNMVYKSLL